VITFEDTYSRHHFLVFQEYSADRLYMITEYPEYLRDEYLQVLKDVV
jgi:hypothetical protein